MKEQVKIEITGIHKIEGETDRITNSFIGKYSKKNEKHYIRYSEATEDGEINTLIKVEDEMVQIIKKGIQNSRMIFKAGEVTKSAVGTMYGLMDLDIDTRELLIVVSDDRIKVKLDYALKLQESILNECKMNIVCE